MMAGSVEANSSGHSTLIQFDGKRILFRIADFRSARKLQATPIPGPALVRQLLSFADLEVYAQVGKRKKTELFPNPGWVVRLLSPQLRRLLNA